MLQCYWITFFFETHDWLTIDGSVWLFVRNSWHRKINANQSNGLVTNITRTEIENERGLSYLHFFSFIPIIRIENTFLSSTYFVLYRLVEDIIIKAESGVILNESAIYT